MVVADEIEALLSGSPSLTEAEIAATLLGEASSLPRISRARKGLIKWRRIERSGRGGRNEPFRYFPRNTDGSKLSGEAPSVPDVVRRSPFA